MRGLALAAKQSLRPFRSVAWVGGLCALAIALVIAAHSATRAGFPSDDSKRIQELQTSEAHLYRQIANREAQLESQRKVYITRIRKLEDALLQKDREIARLKTRVLQATSTQEFQ